MYINEIAIASTKSTYDFNKKDDGQLIRPNILRGKVIQIDPVSGIIVSTANRLFRSLELIDKCIGVIVSTKITHKSMIVDFVNSVHDNNPSPSKFASCALNASASMVALALEVDGPTVTLCGRSASLSNAQRLARMYIQRGDADMILLLDAFLTDNSKLNCCAYAII